MFLSIAALFLSLTALAIDANAAFYKYTDRNGAVVIVDDLKKVPHEYQSQVKEAKLAPASKDASPEAVRVVTLEEEVENIKKAKEANKAAATGASAPPQQDAGKLARIKAKFDDIYDTPGVSFIFLAIGIIVGFILFITGASMLGERLGSKKLGSLISIVISAGVLLYLFTAQMDKISANFSKAMSIVNTVKKQSTSVSKESEDALRESEVHVRTKPQDAQQAPQPVPAPNDAQVSQGK